MGIKTVPHPSYFPDLDPSDFWLFPKLRGCRYETLEEMKEAVTKVIETLTQEDSHRAFHKLLERYNKCIVAGGDYFEDSNTYQQTDRKTVKSRDRKRHSHTYIYIYIYIYIYMYIVLFSSCNV